MELGEKTKTVSPFVNGSKIGSESEGLVRLYARERASERRVSREMVVEVSASMKAG